METPIRSILIIRLSAIGDILMASPLIDSLRRRYPQAHIAWLVQAEGSELIEEHPLLDEIIVWRRQHWRDLWRRKRIIRLFREVKDLVQALRRRRFDLVLDLQGLLKSGIWAWCSGARQRIGLDSREGSARLMTRVVMTPDSDSRIGSEYRALVTALGLQADPFRLQLALTEADELFADQLIQQHNLAQGYVVICPFTTRPQKHWMADRWPLLAAEIRRHFGLAVVMLGGPANLGEAGAMLTNDTGIINLVGATRLRQAGAVIARARALVGVDTGLTHMGIACGIPVIALFGSTCPYLHTDLETTRILYKGLPCAPCRRNPTCDGRFDCMQQITVTEVVDSLRELNPAAVRPQTQVADRQ